jgi:hypothetical protein
MLGVDVVDPDGLVAHQHLARSRVRRGHLDRAQHLRTAVRVDPHRQHVRHSRSPPEEYMQNLRQVA